jgi:hypothetical protein
METGEHSAVVSERVRGPFVLTTLVDGFKTRVRLCAVKRDLKRRSYEPE